MNTVGGNKLVQHLGEWIFPQRLSALIEQFTEQEILQAIEQGYIGKSRSKIGASVQAMRKKAGYVELTDEGWKLYDSINQTNEDKDNG